MKPLVSVIITAYNRADKLKKVLEAYSKQTYPKNKFEIVIIDDGSTENTKKIINKFISNRVGYFRQKNKGPAATRNNGISKARGRYILITGDDILPTKKFLEEHMKLHEKENGIAVVGQTKWAPWIKHNEFLDFFVPFAYAWIKDRNNCTFHFFYTSNISLEKKWFNLEKFDEKFVRVAYEDTELGYRLCKRGLRIVYNEKALAYHDHQYDISSLENHFKRQFWYGEAAAMFYKKQPELRELLITKHNKIKYPVYLFLIKTRLIYLVGLINKKLMWRIISSFNYIAGFNSKWNKINRK